jgi:hypothetical protein
MDTPKHSLPILYPGNCEPLKAAFHAVALGLAAVMAAYNAAAWMRRRQSHLAVNAVVYMAAMMWEQRHVAHHLEPCLLPALSSDAEARAPSDDASPARAA